MLAIVDATLVFSDQVRPGTDALHAIVPVGAAGRPLPALQDATLGHALFGWLDILAPALCAALLAGASRLRVGAALLTAIASLAFGLILLSPIGIIIVTSSKSDFDLASPTVIVALFAGMILIEGLATAWLIERLGRGSLLQPRPRPLRYVVLGAIALLGFVSALQFSIAVANICLGAALLMTVLAFNLLGDGLRDALDPRLR